MPTGSVLAFDEHAGHGLLKSDDGRHHFFHCTAIADGSRTINVGAMVSFRVVPGHNGRWEAAEIRPC